MRCGRMPFLHGGIEGCGCRGNVARSRSYRTHAALGIDIHSPLCRIAERRVHHLRSADLSLLASNFANIANIEGDERDGYLFHIKERVCHHLRAHGYFHRKHRSQVRSRYWWLGFQACAVR